MPDGSNVGRKPSRNAAAASAVEALKRSLGPLADVRAPYECDEPILADIVRLSLYQWLTEIRSRDELSAVGVKPRTSAMLYGPPGTGKTTLAWHLAGRLGIPMVLVGPENIISSYLGASANNAARLFDALREAKTPAVLFIDEIDAIGASREGSRGDACSREITNTLTVIMRKVEEYDGFLLAATNRREAIDPALWRRFNIQLSVDLPGYEQRWAIIKRYSLPYDLDDDDIDLLAQLTDRASPALLRGLMEGMKRALVIGPKTRLSIDDPAKVFMPIIRSVEPPPGLDKPPLWSNSASVAELRGFKRWPPAVVQNPAPEKDGG